MILKLNVHDTSGRDNGIVRLRMEFGSNQWALEEDTRNAWTSRITQSAKGDLEVIGNSTVLIKDQQPGKPKTVVVKLLNVPATDTGTGNAGIGVVEAGGNIFWAFESATYSPIRATMLQLLDKMIPTDLSSDMASFKTLTGYDTKRLKDEFWDPPADSGRVKNTNFTCCNLTLGNIARLLGSALGKPVGAQLLSGPLHLYKADRDRPGSYVKPDGTNFPKPGDFYSVNGLNMYKEFQQYKHVGMVSKVENGAWQSIDGGQGGNSQGRDWIKRVNRGPVSTANMNGWIDIDKYFA